MFMTAIKPHVAKVNLQQFSRNLLFAHSQRNWPFVFLFGGLNLGYEVCSYSHPSPVCISTTSIFNFCINILEKHYLTKCTKKVSDL